MGPIEATQESVVVARNLSPPSYLPQPKASSPPVIVDSLLSADKPLAGDIQALLQRQDPALIKQPASSSLPQASSVVPPMPAAVEAQKFDDAQAARYFVRSFGTVAVYVADTPNLGCQSMAARLVRYLVSDVKVARVIIVTDKKDPIAQQTVTVHLKLKEGQRFDKSAFLRHYAGCPDGDSSRICTITEGKTSNSIIMNKSVEGSPTNEVEIHESLKAFLDLTCINAHIKVEPGGGHRHGLSCGDYQRIKEGYTEFKFEFTCEQPEVTTDADKMKMLLADLLTPGTENPRIQFVLRENLQPTTPGETMLLLQASADHRGSILPPKGGIAEKFETIVEIQMHGPDDEFRRVAFLHRSGRTTSLRPLPMIPKDADYPVILSRDPLAVLSSHPLRQANLQALMEQEPGSMGKFKHQTILVYGTHQLHQTVLQHTEFGNGIVAALTAEAEKTGASLGRPVLIYVILSKEKAPALEGCRCLGIDSPELVTAYAEVTTQPLVVFCSDLPQVVFNALLAGVMLVIAEGKGTISTCRSLNIPHLIIPQELGEDGMKTKYHECDAHEVLMQTSQDLITRGRTCDAVVTALGAVHRERLGDTVPPNLCVSVLKSMADIVRNHTSSSGLT